jgi:microcystin-dependent protein
MAKIYGQLERAQIEGLTSDPTGINLVVGRLWYRTDTLRYKVYDGTATQEFVDLILAQTLQNKILESAQLNTPTIQGDTTINELGSTPANPAAGNHKLYYKNDGKLYTLDSAGNEVEVGSGGGGGGKNYIDDTSANIDNTVGSWLTDDGAGSASAGLTLSVTAVVGELLAGVGSLKLVKDAADRNGHFIKVASETIDPSDYGRQLFGSLEFRPGTGYVTGDLIVEVFDVTNAAVLYSGSPEDVELWNSRGRANWVTYLEGTTAQVELRLKVNNTNANTFEAFFDEVKFGPGAPFLSIASGPVAEVIALASSVAPPSFLECDGTAVSRTQYADLYNAIGITHGQGDGATTFNLPDYRGRFLRGHADGSTRDPDRATRTAMATGGNTGDNVGSVQTDEFGSHDHGGGAHTHNIPYGNIFNGAASVKIDGKPLDLVGTISSGSAVGTVIDLEGGSETRPENAYVKFFIRFSSTTNVLNTNELSLQSFKAATNLKLPTGTITNGFRLATFASIDINDGDNYNTSTGQWIAPRAGEISVSAYMEYTYTAASNIGSAVEVQNSNDAQRVRGIHTPAGSSSGGRTNCAGVIKVNKGDVIQVMSFCSGASAAFSTAFTGCGFSIAYLQDLKLYGVVKNEEYLELETSSFLSSTGVSTGTWVVPSAGFVLPLTPGTWDLGFLGPVQGYSAAGNFYYELALATSTTPGSGIITQNVASQVATTASVDRYAMTSLKKDEYIVTAPTNVYVHMKPIDIGGLTTATLGFGQTGASQAKIFARRIK